MSYSRICPVLGFENAIKDSRICPALGAAQPPRKFTYMSCFSGLGGVRRARGRGERRRRALVNDFGARSAPKIFEDPFGTFDHLYVLFTYMSYFGRETA